MSLYAIKDEDGKLRDVAGASPDETDGFLIWTKRSNANDMQETNYPDGHLVELVPAKPKVPVSREEAEMLRKAGADGYSVGKTIVDFVNNAGLDTVICSDENLLQHEDRLIRAYVDGYTVAEPTKYNVKVPHVEDSVYGKMSDGILAVYDAGSKCDFMQFTMAEIKHYGLEGCERVEIDTEDSNE